MTDLFVSDTLRISTVVMAVLFLTTAIWRRRPLAGLAALGGWLFGFEIVWLWTGLLVHGSTMVQIAHETVFGAGWILAAEVAGIRPDWRWLVLLAVGWTVWVLTGFHSNDGPGPHFNWLAEALNEINKTLWGLAYLWPLAKSRPHVGSGSKERGGKAQLVVPALRSPRESA